MLIIRIKSYEPFHIGSKIRYYVDLGHLIAKLYDHFEENPKENFETNENILSRDKFFSPLFNILTNKKEKMTIQLSYTANALNVIGNKPENVIDLFLDLMDILPSLGFELESTFSFYEIITNIILFIDGITPSEIFENLTSKKLSEINYIPDLNINFLRFTDKFNPMEDEERFQLELVPNRTNPNKSIILRILNRSLDYNKLKKFQENLENIIKEVYNKLVD